MTGHALKSTKALVIIPAHNEAKVLEATLNSLCNDPGRDLFDILVVSNGSTDDTVAVARRFAPEIALIELEAPSKWQALNAGRAMADGRHCVYVDADIVVSRGAVSAVIGLLEGGAEAAAPRVRLEAANPSFFTRAYLSIWTRSPYFRDGFVGAGFYALNASVFHRIGPFPDIIADDQFVLAAVNPAKRRTASDAWFVHRVPDTLRAVIRQEFRREAGRYQFETFAASHQIPLGSAELNRGWLKPLVFSPRQAPAAMLFIGTKLWARMIGRFLLRIGRLQWAHIR